MNEIQSSMNILPVNGELFLSNLIQKQDADDLLSELILDTPWKQEGMWMFGKYVDFPRLTAWYGDEGKTYEYSGLKNIPLPWTSTLHLLKSNIEAYLGVPFNSVLMNYYRNGNDSMGWHSDDEKELGANPYIASLNLGATRKMQFRHKKQKELKLEVELVHGSLLVMSGEIQHHWQHQIPKQKKVMEPRINLTFRCIL
jgi:alkylated DNA repair dioxygenase AlkB